MTISHSFSPFTLPRPANLDRVCIACIDITLHRDIALTSTRLVTGPGIGAYRFSLRSTVSTRLSSCKLFCLLHHAAVCAAGIAPYHNAATYTDEHAREGFAYCKTDSGTSINDPCLLLASAQASDPTHFRFVYSFRLCLELGSISPRAHHKTSERHLTSQQLLRSDGML